MGRWKRPDDLSPPRIVQVLGVLVRVKEPQWVPGAGISPDPHTGSFGDVPASFSQRGKRVRLNQAEHMLVC